METLTEKKQEVKINSDLTKSIIAFQKGFMLEVDRASSKQKRLTIQAELMKLGFMLDKDALENATVEWFQEVLPYIKKALGIGKYTPFYKNFPQQVMEMDECELYMNAIMHYWSLGKWEPSYELERRGIKFEHPEFKIITLETEKKFKEIFTTLVSINQSITENDKQIVEWFVANTKVKLPDHIPFKENLCMLAGLGLDIPVKGPTDVLRIAVYLSGGDISLPMIPKISKADKSNKGIRSYFVSNRTESQNKEREKFKFKHFKRRERKIILSLLEKSNLDLGEMKLKLGRWLRLGEILHPGEYKDRFPKSFKAFDKLRNHPDKIRTFYSKVDEAFDKKPIDGINLLAQRPGEFARKLDWMLRTYDSALVLKKFKEVSINVSRKVLWELYNHFLNRDTSSQRSIMLKGKKSKRKVLEPLPPMSKILINKIQNEILGCIAIHFSKLEKLGGVWIDERLKKVPLPFAMRSVNTAIKTYVRGTRIPFGNEDAKVIRAYIHWNDVIGEEDLDLSASFYSSDLKNKGHISYTNLKDMALNSCHSGDIRHRMGPCAEYVDIDIHRCLSEGVRYVMVGVYNFQQRPMHTMKDCVFGIMEREFPEENKIFLPPTIANAMRIANESSTVCICVLDLKSREYIWTDLELDTRNLANIESTSDATEQILIDLIHSNKLSVYDLFTLHGEARGKMVGKSKAKTKFEYEDYVTSYEKVASFM